MFFIYILLIIIAIGVLLASEAGHNFLNLLIKLLVVGGLFYLGFWVVIFAIALFSNKDIRDSIFIVLGIIMLVAYAIYGIYIVYKKKQSGELTNQAIKTKVKNWFIKQWKDTFKLTK